MLKRAVAPTMWDQVGGPCSITYFKPRHLLIVDATDNVQWEIRTVLEQLPKSRSEVLSLRAHSDADRKIAAALNEKTDFDFTGAPLSTIVAYLRQHHRINMEIDGEYRQRMPVTVDSPITCKAKGISLRSALCRLLEPLDLIAVVRDEVLLVTPRAERNGELSARLYPVSDDLFDPHSLRSIDDLIDYLKSFVAPTTWDKRGGAGEIWFFPVTNCLLVSQTDEIHSELVATLDGLREHP